MPEGVGFVAAAVGSDHSKDLLEPKMNHANYKVLKNPHIHKPSIGSVI